MRPPQRSYTISAGTREVYGWNVVSVFVGVLRGTVSRLNSEAYTGPRRLTEQQFSCGP